MPDVSNHSVVSMWQGLPRSLLYPLHLEPALVIVVAGFILWIFSTSLFGLPILLGTTLGLFQYLLLCLKHSATGEQSPPRISITEFRQLGAMPVKMLLVIAAWAGLSAQAGAFTPAAGTALAIAGMMLLPAFTTLLALEESLRVALNPVRLLRFILRGGVAYMLLAAAFALLAWNARLELTLAELVFTLRPATIWLWIALGLYAALASANLLGRVAHATHDFRPPEGHTIEANRQPPDPDSPTEIARRLDELLREGNRDAILHAWNRHADRDHGFQVELLDALLRQRAWPLVPRQAQRAVTALLTAGRRNDALQLTMRTRNTHASFATVNADEWLSLCETAAETGRHDWLATLAGVAPERFPDASALLDIALLHARHLAQDKGEPQAALIALRPFIGWTAHPRHVQLKRLEAVLKDMATG